MDAADKKADSRSIRKAFGYFKVMAGHEVEGLRPGQIAKAVGVGPATVTRDLRALRECGAVEQVPGMDDRWRLGPIIVQIALAHMQGIERMQARVNETRQRFSRDPN